MPHPTHKLTRKLSLTLAAFALACACLASIAPASRRARAQDDDANQQSKTEKPTSAVYGRAVYADTERPVRRGRVRLFGVGGDRVDVNGLTDANGEFRIKGVRAGSYFIMIDVAGLMSPVSFVSLEELRGGSLDTEDIRKYFEVVETNGKEDKQVTVRARRGAAIAGKVTYSDGDPAVNLFIQIMRRGDGRLVKFFAGTSGGALTGMLTDDRGMYRVAGLPPGEYVVAVSEPADHGDGGKDGDNFGRMMMMGILSPQLLTTFHASAMHGKDAITLKVGAGEERGDVDISIPDRALRVVSGVVRGRRDKRPLARARVNIVPNDRESGTGLEHLYSGLMESGVWTDEDGRWQLKEIPDGQYTITVKPSDEYEPGGGYTNGNMNMNANVTISSMNSNMSGSYTPPRRKRAYAPAQREVNVSGEDVTELAVELSEGARVSGTVVIEGGKPPEYAHVSAMRATSNLEEMLIAGDVPGATVTRGVFTIEGLPAGKFFLHPNTYLGEETKLYLKSITWNGKDMLREPLDVGEGATLEGVRIVYSNDPAKLRVRAVSADKKPAHNVNVFLVPSDAPNWSPYSVPPLFCSTGEEGECSISAPPGDYAVVTMPRRIMNGAVGDEIKTRATTSPRVSLRAGETKNFEVKVAER
ncbi:MAG: hypothetical protein H7Z38_01800 [Rubrivivax sp.]|nr:hypothetical protein [Pyrinomonadaceae bacterium]